MYTGLTIAISKGRIYDEALPLLARAGVSPGEDPARTRRLVVPTGRPDVRLLIVRAQDVPTYVEHGAAEIGIAGKDVLLEHQGEGLYEPLDLRIARCRMVVAAAADAAPAARRPRVATKYVATTRRHFAARGVQVEIIRLYGSMELAPLVGLAERIVDLVDTGNTLLANGLTPLEEICEISARLVVNKGAMKMKHEPVKAFIADMAQAMHGAGALAGSGE